MVVDWNLMILDRIQWKELVNIKQYLRVKG